MKFDRLVVTDVDGVIADIDKPVENDMRELLLEISKYSLLAFASGRPASYLEGLARGIGLSDVIVIAENGAVVRIPNRFEVSVLPKDVGRWREDLEGDLNLRYGPNIKFQHNIVNLTINCRDPKSLDEIGEFCRESIRSYGLGEGVKMLRHIDSVEIVPKAVDKSEGVKYISTELGIPMERIIVAGDGINDIDMLKTVRVNRGTAVCIGSHCDLVKCADKNFPDGVEALRYILKIIK